MVAGLRLFTSFGRASGAMPGLFLCFIAFR
jgi:hypothetical protein